MDPAEIIKSDPGNPVFAEVADVLRENGDLTQALQVCLQGVEANASCHLGRLVLARVFFDMGCTSFAIRELAMLRQWVPSNVSLMRLVERLSPDAVAPQAAPAPQGETVRAAAALSLDDLEALDDEEGGK